MCGRYASQIPAELVARMFATSNPLPNPRPTWNMAPTQSGMVVRRHPKTCERHLDLLSWGLVPPFEKDLKKARRPINARSETAATSGMFRSALKSRWALVPADAFYEWRSLPDGKQPFAIARTDGAPLAFAGIWEGWRSPKGEIMRTYAILTTSANGDMAALHERIPVIVEPNTWARWLGEEDGDPLELMRPASEGVVRIWPVSRKVNSVRNDGQDLLDEVTDPGPKAPQDRALDINPA